MEKNVFTSAIIALMVFVGTGCHKACAQDYHPMVLDGLTQQWNVLEEIGHPMQGYYNYHTNTIISGSEMEALGHTYKTLGFYQDGSSVFNTCIGMREENKKVFFLFDSPSHEELYEELYYDFNIQIGDSIFDMELTRIDSIEEWGSDGVSYRKRYVFDEDDRCFYWIEGIGSLFDPLWNCNGICGYERTLLCYHEADNLVYMDPYHNTCEMSNENASEREEQRFAVFPNPAHNSFVIRGDGEYSYVIFNAIGQKVANGSATGEQQINVGGLAKGVYSIRLTSGTETCMKKMMLE